MEENRNNSCENDYVPNNFNVQSCNEGSFSHDDIVIKTEPVDQNESVFESCKYENLVHHFDGGKSNDVMLHDSGEVDLTNIKTESTELIEHPPVHQCIDIPTGDTPGVAEEVEVDRVEVDVKSIKSESPEHSIVDPFRCSDFHTAVVNDVDPNCVKTESDEVKEQSQDLPSVDSTPICDSVLKSHEGPSHIPSIAGSWLSSLKSKLQSTITLAVEEKNKKDLTKRRLSQTRDTTKKEAGPSLKVNRRTSGPKKEPMKCRVCDFKTDKKSLLIKHLKQVHIEPNTFICDGCVSFKTSCRDKLNEHKREQHDNFPLFYCSLCSFKSVWEKGLVAHINTVHRNEKLYHCYKCFYVTQQKSLLEVHYNLEHFGEKPYQCNDCSFQATFKKGLLSHINDHHNVQAYLCSMCGFKTNRSKTLQDHVRSVHENIKYSCFSCNLQTSTEKELISHIELTHSQSLVFGCNDCGFRTSTKKKLSYHIKRIHNCCLNETIYNKCHHCDNSYFSKEHLKRHIVTVHLEFVKYKCYVCNYKTNVKKYFKRHVTNKHKKIKRYQCLRCDFNSYMKSTLDLHIINEHLESNPVRLPARSIFNLWKDELKRQIYGKDICKNTVIKEEFKIF